MNRKLIFLIAILGIAYAAYGLLNQKFKDEQFRDNCEQNPNRLTALTFVLSKTTDNTKLALKIKRSHDNPLDKVIFKDSKKSEFNYTDGFSIHDTLEIVTPLKRYKIYGFEYRAITVNAKKGLECAYNGAYINAKWNDGNVFVLN